MHPRFLVLLFPEESSSPSEEEPYLALLPHIVVYQVELLVVFMSEVHRVPIPLVQVSPLVLLMML